MLPIYGQMCNGILKTLQTQGHPARYLSMLIGEQRKMIAVCFYTLIAHMLSFDFTPLIILSTAVIAVNIE